MLGVVMETVCVSYEVRTEFFQYCLDVFIDRDGSCGNAVDLYPEHYRFESRTGRRLSCDFFVGFLNPSRQISGYLD
jgi:hypothetical protein